MDQLSSSMQVIHPHNTYVGYVIYVGALPVVYAKSLDTVSLQAEVMEAPPGAIGLYYFTGVTPEDPDFSQTGVPPHQRRKPLSGMFFIDRDNTLRIHPDGTQVGDDTGWYNFNPPADKIVHLRDGVIV